MSITSFFNALQVRFLSEKTKEQSEKAILAIAIVSFIIHLILVYLVHFGWVNIDSKLLESPIAAVYTPFSFILIYEVYLLIYYLPKSITTYIGKQYEIITLIIIRRLFKDLSDLKLSSQWFEIKGDLQFTYDLVASVVLFFLIYVFYSQNNKGKASRKIISPEEQQKIKQFIRLKQVIASILVPLLLIIALYTLADWGLSLFQSYGDATQSFKNINNIFFDEFFTILIIVDVLLLLASFFYSDQFHKVIRNSGFIISTILIRLSFSVDGLLNTLLIISAIVFGLLILMIHNKFEQESLQ
jgi:hypothetical protein